MTDSPSISERTRAEDREVFDNAVRDGGTDRGKCAADKCKPLSEFLNGLPIAPSS